MEETSITADQIIQEATNWTFQSDCSLLQWMKQIAANMEKHAVHTNAALENLTENVKRTGTALDNAANSLTALQYSQFVENRCHDDDDDLKTHNARDNTALPEEEIISSKDDSTQNFMEMFLNNNLDMLRNCHEKYVIDLEDSDDEDTETNFIYQPKNQYNDRPLPHIYGSKLWQQHWHIGLCDDEADEHSDEEDQEAFSESSSSSEELASASGIQSSVQISATNSSKSLSLSASTEKTSTPIPPLQSNSIIKDNTTPSHQQIPAGTKNKNRHIEHDLFAELPNTPSTLSHSSVSIEPHETSQGSPASMSSSSHFEAKLEAVIPSIPAELPPKAIPVNQIKRKPVNLFDDDDFNSLMTAIVDKANSKTAENDKSQPKLNQPELTEKLIPQAAPRRRDINLFDSPEDEIPPRRENSAGTEHIIPKTDIPMPIPKKKTPLNLFDSPENSPPEKSVTAITSSEKAPALLTKTKSLFDDDEDDDDDFLNVFASSKKSIPAATTARLFDDSNANKSKVPEQKETSVPPTIVTTKTIESPIKGTNLFADDDDDGDGDTEPPEYTQTNRVGSNLKPVIPKLDLFSSDDEEEVPQTTTTTSSANVSTIKDLSENVVQPQVIMEDTSDNEDDWLNTRSATQKLTKETPSENLFSKHEETTNESSEEPPKDSQMKMKESLQNIATAKSNYSNIFMDEPPDDDDFFNAMDNSLNPPSLHAHNESEENENEGFFEAAESSSRNIPPVKTSDQLAGESSHGDYSRQIGDYGGLHLFSDVPPDDDDDADEDLFGPQSSVPSLKEDVRTQNLQNVFYDDFKETIGALQASQNIAKNSLLFMENSNPDRDPIRENNQGDGLLEQSQDETDQLEQGPVRLLTKKLSKLPILNINVHALLPNAPGDLNSKKSIDQLTEREDEKSMGKAEIFSKSSQITIADENASSQYDILPSICKTRARLPTTRRPSTRRGRQENYQKSLLIEQDMPAEEVGTSTMSSRAPNFSDLFANEQEDHDEGNLFSSKMTQAQFITNRSIEESSPVLKEPQYDNNIIRRREEVVVVDKANSGKTRNEPQTTCPTFTDLFGSSPPEDILFGSNLNTENVTKVAPSFTPFFSPEPEDSSFESEFRQSSSKTNSSLHITFLSSDNEEEDDDDDDLFKSIGTLPKVAHEIAIPVAEKPKELIPNKVVMSTGVSLFGDDEDTDDSDGDLFKSPQTKATQFTKPAQPTTATLFGDDDDDKDDNDDFLSTSASKTKSETMSEKKTAPQGKSLFSDVESDDDDDLFGSKPSTTKVKKIMNQTRDKESAAKAQHQLKPNAPSTGMPLTDNPLADLLKE